MEETKICQYGEKSVYVEQNTGQISIHSNGEVRIINPTQTEGLALLRQEFGERFTEIMAVLKDWLPKGIVPHQLTTAGATVPSSFLGRERELAEIRALLTSHNTLALVNAEGGMGKTTLAAAYWHRHQAQYKHCAWLFCETGIFTAMRRHLPEPLALQEAMNRYADDPEQQIEVVKNRMANLEKDCLLVLDNANDPEHIRSAYPFLSSLGWHVLLTSRCAQVLPEGEYRIESLLPGEAKALFQQNYTENTPDFEGLLDRFLVAVGYNTLCIEIFSKNLRAGVAWGLNFQKLLQQLEQKGLLLGEGSFEIATVYTHNVRRNAANSDAIVEALYDVGRLEPDETALLTQCCLLPAESHIPEVLIALLDPEHPSALKRRLDRLAQKGWMGTDTHSYRVSPVVQKIVLQKNADQRRTLGAPLVERLTTLFETEGYHSKNIATAAPFAALVPELVANLGAVGETLADLFHQLWVYHNAIGNLAKALDTAERMCVYCEKNGFTYNLGRAYQLLGETHTALGNLPQALTFFEKDIELSKDLFEAFPQNVSCKKGLAISYSKLGNTHSALGNLPQALTFFEQCNCLEKELYDAYPQNVSFKQGLAISYSKLGDTHTALGDLQQALTFFEDETKLFEALYDAYPQNVSFKHGLAISYSKLGERHSALGNLPQALTFFEQYNALEKELFDAYPQNVSFKNSLAISYQFLGNTHSALGNFPQALTFFEQYNALEKELFDVSPQNVSFKNNLASSYSKLGSTLSALGNLPQALTFFEQCNCLEKELYDAYPQNVSFKNGLAISYQFLGNTHNALGNLQQALIFFEQYNNLRVELYKAYPQNVSFKNGLAISYYKLGQLYEQTGDLEKAFLHFEQNLKFTELTYQSSPSNAKFKENLRISYNQMGNISEKLNRKAQAQTFYDKAKDLGD